MGASPQVQNAEPIQIPPPGICHRSTGKLHLLAPPGDPWALQVMLEFEEFENTKWRWIRGQRNVEDYVELGKLRCS